MFDNIPAEHHEEVQRILDEATAKVKAEYETKLQEKTAEHTTLESKVNDLQAEVSASKKFETIKASYPADKADEILDVLKKVELKTATSDEVLKLSTMVIAKETKQDLRTGDGDNGKKYSETQLDSMFGIKARKSA